MGKKNVLILQGGENEEHEVSINTAIEVKEALLQLGYDAELFNVNPITFIGDIGLAKTNICFNALHGSFGEDGQIQKILYNFGISYTHSGISASFKGFNKSQTKKCLENTKINFLKSTLLHKSKLNKKFLNEIFQNINPFVIKPVSSGSSFGVRVIKSHSDIEKMLFDLENNKFNYDKHNNLIIEPYINGRELTVSVIQNENKSQPIEVTEIVTKTNFFDYKSKYTKGLSKHIIPAKIPEYIYNQCLNHAKIAHDTIGCSGVTRSDFIFSEEENKIFFLEINTQPGLTSVSLVPEQLNYNGIDFIELIDLLIKSARCQK